MSDVENWNADMDAWGLTGDERTHHLHRLHDYHRRIEALWWRRYERSSRAQGWFALLTVVSAVVALVAGAVR
jgi:hypothetical protein